MNKLTQFFIGLSIVAFSFTSCESLLDVDSDLIAFPEDNQINTANDSIYNMMGIFSHLEKLAESYVILGELRADLMSTTSYAKPALQEVYNQSISATNPYNVVSDYYAVINHCNYLIQTVDTSIVSQSEKVMYKQYAAAKAIRAWTYMQLVQNYGKAMYYDIAILDAKDFGTSMPEYSLEELYPVLIADLLPWEDLKMPGGIGLGPDMDSEKLFFPIPFLLGEMYLGLGEYENAAREFYNLIEKFSYINDERYRNYWEVDNTAFVTRYFGWDNIFDLVTNEQITLIAGSTEFGNGAPLDSLSFALENEISPSDIAIQNWKLETYYHSNVLSTEGDLRGDQASYYSPEMLGIGVSNLPIEKGLIYKYMGMSSENSKAINIYRIATLYLRYAEAVNRMGKPNLAFAVLKHGLNRNTLAVDSIIPRSEKYAVNDTVNPIFYSYVDFTEPRFNDNLGIHSRGAGNVHLASEYRIPNLPSSEDSIQYVEDEIIAELALETAFEGNRFHDLMRIANRRGSNAYLANKIAEKYTDNQEEIRTKLLDPNAWYLPYK